MQNDNNDHLSGEANLRLDFMATFRDMDEELRVICYEHVPEEELNSDHVSNDYLELTIENAEDPKPDPKDVALLRLIRDSLKTSEE